ncbi:MAG: glycerophosphodiester phosphodiesterase, partial [Sphingomonadales bacterium]
ERLLPRDGSPVAVMSFSPPVVAWFRDHDPDTVRGLVASTRYRRELGWRLSSPAAHAALADNLNVDFVAYDIRSLPNVFTIDWRRTRRPLLTWTVRTDGQRIRAARFTDAIIFEHP